jgi:hypothetical protein
MNTTDINTNTITLHTLKELTDEEILAVFAEGFSEDIPLEVQASAIEFAKAILRKAQDK